ncbi:winged helix-turn-helix domain-containing protein [Bradyrhizobium barranii subsp. apii]|uniref:Winged helix-turn-helix domain-containing protein n=1 Tax=Bradyrhizobium barranii subsp. apii TaxID=2819348 RepID=A0A8T5V4P2_9BRAD|nr:winged helix-turn-helix domain-containing protein [Bradyrhizobium barranii]UPT86080.1 winged helix-turn-helix domain-containing protein [Bradyrhizobium barranii subsp. apii]
MRYFFEDYSFDTDRRELRRGPGVIPTTPQVFDLLDFLIRNKDRVVSKDDLIRAVWNGRIVSDAALTTRLNAARAAIGDDGDKQRLIKTLPRKGFRFVGAVEEEQNPATASASSTVSSDGTAQNTFSPPRLSMLVLPLANLSNDPAQDYFVDGVTENLTTDLSRIRGSFVIARHTAFAYKGKPIDLKQIGRELHVRYVLEGSVQRGGNRPRVNVQLLDAENANLIWAERFETPVTDLFEIQDEIVARLANTLNAQLIAAEARRAERSLNPDALDLHFQGMAIWNKRWTREHVAQARRFFERALELDPDNVDALVGMGMIDGARAGSFLTDNPDVVYAAAEAGLIKALSLAPQHAGAHMSLGALQFCTQRVAQGITNLEHALALNSNLAEAHALIGVAKVYVGRAAETEAHVHEALRLSPRDEGAYRWMSWVGLAKVLLGADAEALVWLRRSLNTNPNYPIAHFELAAALAHLGKLGEARLAVKAGLAVDPTFTIRRLKSATVSNDPTFREQGKRVIQGMRIAGVPEG